MFTRAGVLYVNLTSFWKRGACCKVAPISSICHLFLLLFPSSETASYLLRNCKKQFHGLSLNYSNFSAMDTLSRLGGFSLAPFEYAYLIALGLVFLTSTIVRRRCFSPISNIPGPFLASITRLHHVFRIFKGKQSEWITNLHDEYGPFVRIAPNEVSVSHSDAPKKLLLRILDKVTLQSSF